MSVFNGKDLLIQKSEESELEKKTLVHESQLNKTKYPIKDIPCKSILKNRWYIQKNCVFLVNFFFKLLLTHSHVRIMLLYSIWSCPQVLGFLFLQKINNK